MTHRLFSTVLPSPLGPLTAVADEQALRLLEYDRPERAARQVARVEKLLGVAIVDGRSPVFELLESELAAYFAGDLRDFTTPCEATGTPFEERVWGELTRIPAGETRSYAAIAKAIGSPAATRAVGRANGRNPVSILVPCHRVIGANGTLTGYGGGVDRKRWLIEHERQFSRERLFA